MRDGIRADRRPEWLRRKHGHVGPKPRTKLDLWADKVVQILDGRQTGQHTPSSPDQASAEEARKALNRAARRARVSIGAYLADPDTGRCVNCDRMHCQPSAKGQLVLHVNTFTKKEGYAYMLERYGPDTSKWPYIPGGRPPGQPGNPAASPADSANQPAARKVPATCPHCHKGWRVPPGWQQFTCPACQGTVKRHPPADPANQPGPRRGAGSARKPPDQPPAHLPRGGAPKPAEREARTAENPTRRAAYQAAPLGRLTGRRPRPLISVVGLGRLARTAAGMVPRAIAPGRPAQCARPHGHAPGCAGSAPWPQLRHHTGAARSAFTAWPLARLSDGTGRITVTTPIATTCRAQFPHRFSRQGSTARSSCTDAAMSLPVGVTLPSARHPPHATNSTGATAGYLGSGRGRAGLPRYYRAAPLTAAQSGLRPSEVLGLEVGCVDFLRREIRVRQQLVTSTEPGHIAYLAEPKTPLSDRTVPVTAAAVDMLAAHLAEFPAREVEVEDRTDPRHPKLRAARLIFTTSTSAPVKRSTWSGAWTPAARKAGFPARTGLHCCRHLYASALIRFGESPKTVQHLLGHSSPAITLNVYAHLWPDSDDRARQAIEAAFADVPSMCPAAEGE